MNQNYNFVRNLLTQETNARKEESKSFSYKKQTLLSFFILFVALFSFVQGSSQVTTDGGSGLNTTYPSLAAAVTALNSATITAPVTITLTASETAPAGGYSITASGTSANPITILGGGFTLTAPAQTSGLLNDAIIKIIGGDYITIQNFTLSERVFTPVAADIAAGTNTMTEWGVALLYVTPTVGAPTNGAQNITIQNNTINLNRNYQNTFGIYANATHSSTSVSGDVTATTTTGGNSGMKVYSNTISNVNLGIVVVGPKAVTDVNIGIEIGGSSTTGNTISNFGTTGTFSSYANVSGTVNGILVRNSNGFNISYNTITSSNGGVTAGTLNGIQVPAASNLPTGTYTNTITSNTIALTSGFITGTINGILFSYPTGSASTTSSLNVNNNNFTAATYSSLASGSITLISNASSNQFSTINNNTFTNISSNTTGSFTFITQSASSVAPANGTKEANNNAIVTAFNKTGAGGTVTFIKDSGFNVSGAVTNCQNNNFSNVTLTGATSIDGFSFGDGATATSAPTRTVTGNILNNWTTAGNIKVMTFNYWNGISSLSNNTITNINGQGTITALTIGASSNAATSIAIANNTINNLSSSGTGGAVIGITCTNTSTSIDINGNTINTLSSTGAAAVTAISIGGGTTTNVFKNKIYDISGSNGSSTVNGILVSAGTTVNTYNNIIGDLRAPAANAANPLVGINITGGTTSNVYYNTVRLAGSSTGALFGSSALSASTTPTLNLINNILVNTSTVSGAGLAVAYRRSSATLTSYGSTSNNNLFFGTSALYTDGTATDSALADFKTRVTPRDAASKVQNPAFTSTTGSASTFLHFATGDANFAGNNGAVISGYTTDFDGDTRTSTPDIGADEWDNGILYPPTISSFSTANTTSPNVVLCQAGGQSVTILGTNLGTVTSVLFNGLAGTNIVTTATSITVTTPAGIVAGNIKVINPSDEVTSADGFTTAGSPTVAVTPNLTACAAAGSTLTASGATSYSWAPNTALSASTGASVIASPTANTTYVVTGADANGCTATSSVTISMLLSPPSITAGASSITPCSGSSIDLTSTSGDIQLNLSQTFDSTASFASNGWTISNNGQNPWTISTTVFRNGPGSLYYSSTSTNANTWAFSPAKILEAGVTYTITYWYKTSGAFPESLKLTVGNTTAVADHTTILLDQPSLNNSIYLQATATFTPTTSGTYYFGLNCYSPPANFLSVDDFAITTTPSSIAATYEWTSTPAGFTSTLQNPTGISVNTATTYTITATASGCSRTSSVEVNPRALPTGPTTTDSTQYGAVVPTASVASTSGANGSGTFKWYDAATGGTLLQTSTSTTFLTAVSATRTMYVAEVGTNGCEGARTAITVTVNSSPPLVLSTLAPAAICPGVFTDTPVTITSSSLLDYNTFAWSPSTGVSGDATIGYTFNPTATTTYVLTATNTVTGYYETANVVITVKPSPEITSLTSSNEPLCIGSSTTLTGLSISPVSGTASVGAGATTGTSFDAIFLHSRGGNKTQQLVTAAELTAAGLVSGNITNLGLVIAAGGGTYAGLAIKLAPTTNTNMSAGINNTAAFVSVYTSTSYTATTGTNTFNFTTPFIWDGVSNIIVQFCWSNNNTGGTSNFAKGDTTTFVSTAYYRADNLSPYSICGGTVATSTTSFRPKFIFGGQVLTDISSTYTWAWSPGATLSATSGNVVTASPSVNTLYTVTATNNSNLCSTSRTINVSLISTSTTAPTTTDSSQCGTQIPTASVTSTTAVSNPIFVWYSAATGGTSVQRSASTTFLTAINSTRTMYVSEVGSNGCESPRTALLMTVVQIPVVSINSSVPTFCGTGGNTTLTASSSDTGMTYSWTSLTPSASINASNTAIITATISETSDFKVIGTVNNSSCTSIAYISVGVYPLPTAVVTTTAQGLCPGTSATIGSGLTAGNFTVACIPSPSAPSISPSNAVILVGSQALQTPYPAGVTAFNTSLDDNYWSGIPVGFNFNFFGNTVTNVFIGSNGTINLGTAGSIEYDFTGGFPSTANPASTIAVSARDLRWDSAGAGKISYWTEGIAPNRRFIVQFLNAKPYSFTSGNQTAEAVFYETLGTIDIRVFEATNGTGTTAGNSTSKYIGLQNANQTIGATAPNCDTTPATQSYWNGQIATIASTAPKAWRFSPPSDYATTWYANGIIMPSVAANPSATPPVVGYANPGTNVFSIPVTPASTTTYSISYTNSNSGCSNTPGSAQVTMSVLGNTIPTGLTTTASATTICSGQSVNFSTNYTGTTNNLVVQWQKSTDGGTLWTDIAAANALTLTLTPTSSAIYRCKLTACNGVPGYTSVVPVIFNNSLVSTTPATRCGIGTATLQATASSGATVNWYSSATGGTAIGTGSSFTTPTISSTTTYYASAETIVPVNPTVGSLVVPSDNLTSNSSNGGMVFNTTFSNVRINSADIFVSGSGDMFFILQDSNGVDIASTTLTGIVGSSTALTTVNFPSTFVVPNVGNGYRIICTSITSGLIWYNQTGSYPYNTTGVSITSGWGFSTTSTDLRCIHKLNFTVPTICSSPREAVAVTVTAPTTPITLSGNPASICANTNSAPVTVTSGGSNYGSYVWTPSSVSGDSTNGWVFNPSTTTTYTLLASETTGATPCTNTATVTVTVDPTPSAQTIAPTTGSTCANTILTLVSTGGTLENLTILNQDFNGVTNDWSNTNNSTGGTPALAAWTLRSDGYTHSTFSPFRSNDNSQFYMSNSDAQGAGSTTATVLKSPTFSTVNFSSANLSFYHYLRSSLSTTTATVQYSIDAGTNWVPLQTYTTTQGGTAAFANATIALPAAALNQPTVQIRFKYNDSYGYFWAIDNVSIKGNQVATKVWSPTTNLYTDALATTPYTGQNLSTVYFKSTTDTPTVNYTSTSSSSIGCTSVASVPVRAYLTAAPTGSSTFQFCPTSIATLSNITSTITGSNIKWYAAASGGTPLASTTPLTQGSYWASQTDNGCESPTRLEVSVTSNPTTPPTSNATQGFCNGATVANLNATGAGLQWYTASTGSTALASTVALTSGNYYVSQTSGGCESTRTAVSVTVTTVPAPTGAASQSLSSLLTLGDIVVTGSNIVWYASAADAASGSNPLLSTQLLANTTYYATQTVGGCTSSTSLAVTITTLANQDFDMAQFTYSPNPVIDLLYISYSQEITNVKVFNMIGQQLMSKKINSNSAQIDMSGYANGAYFIQVATETAMKTVKVIKK
jgi:hypothetical protein